MKRRLLLISTSAILVVASAALAQPAATDSGQSSTIPFIDKTFGYEIQVPDGWSYDRTGFFGPGNSLGTLRGIGPGGRETLQILVFREQELTAFPEWVKFFSKQLGGLGGTTSVRVKGTDCGGRPAAFVLADARIGVDQTQTAYYCVQFEPGTVWVFSHAAAGAAPSDSPGEDSGVREVRIPPGFTNLTGTLRVFYNPEQARRMAAAVQRGREFLSRYELQAAIRNLRTDDSVRHYEISVAGEPIGFLTRQFTVENEPMRDAGQRAIAKEGVRVRERSYRFAPDGSTSYNKVDLFSSRDGETDLYEILQAGVPPPDNADGEVWIARDQCVREGDSLFSTRATSRDRGLPPPRRPLKLDASYLGLGWVRLLPAMVGDEAQSLLGFTIYDVETRALVTHAIKRLSEHPLPAGVDAKTLAFEIRAGFAEAPDIVYTDKFGNMLRHESGNLALTLADEQQILKRYGDRRAAADRRLRQQSGKP